MPRGLHTYVQQQYVRWSCEVRERVSLVLLGGWQKGVHPQKPSTKRGTLIFAGGEVFDIHVAVGINLTAQHDVCAPTVHYSPYMHHDCLLTAQRPTPCGASTLFSETPNVRTGKHMCAPRACVLFKSLIILRAFWTENSYRSAVKAASRLVLCAQCHVYIPLPLYAAVVVVDAHITKYQVVDIIGTMIFTRVHTKEACFATPASPRTTLGRPGLQWVYV